MSLIFSDRVKEQSITSGIGNITLAGAYGGFQTFLSAIGNGNQTYYVIENESQWEVGLGTYTSTTNTLSRDQVFSSSNGGSKISLSGVSIVFCSYIADKVVIKDINNIVNLSKISLSSGITFPDNTFQNTGANAISGWADSTMTARDNAISGWSKYHTDNKNTFNDVEISGTLTLSAYDNQPLTIKRTTAGSFFHAYKDDVNDRTVALSTDGLSSPTWKLGVKTSPSDFTASPNIGYIYGTDGEIGLVANSNNQITISSSTSFTVKHQNIDMLTASYITGVHINSTANNYPALIVNGGALLSNDIQQWQSYAGTVLSVVDKDGRLAIKKSSASYDIDVNGSGRLQSIYLTSGIYFQDGTFQSTSSSSNSNNNVNTKRQYSTKSSNYSMISSDDVIFTDSTNGALTIILPPASGNGGQELLVKRVAGTNLVTLQASGSETIDGLSSFSVNYQNESVSLVSNNLNWFIT